MNKIFLIGRLTKEIEMYGNGETKVAKYTLAVDRRFKKEGEQNTDFISCVAFGKQGEFAEKYLQKGMKIAVTGRIQTGSYKNRDGNTVYTTDVVVEEHEFCESRQSEGTTQAKPQPTPNDLGNGFFDIPDGIDDELPFN